MNPQRRQLLSRLGMVCLSAACWAPIESRAAGLPELVRRAKSSLVLVGTYAETDNPRFTFRGTGFCVGRGNFVVTNAHVLADSGTDEMATGRQLSIQTRSVLGSWIRRSARILVVDHLHDLALLEFQGEPVPVVSLAKPGIAQEGNAIALIGFPLGGALGFSPVTHRGVIAAITSIALPPPSARSLNPRAIRQLREGTFDILQLDATAYPGNSGGPVFDIETGEVVGVLNMVLVKGSKETALTQPSGISYAIPSQFVSDLLGQVP